MPTKTEPTDGLSTTIMTVLVAGPGHCRAPAANELSPAEAPIARAIFVERDAALIGNVWRKHEAALTAFAERRCIPRAWDLNGRTFYYGELYK